MEHLLKLSGLRHDAVPYDKIKGDEYLPALKKAMELGKENIERVKKVESPNFINIIEAIESSDDEVSYIAGIFYGLYSAHCTDDIQKISEEFSNLLTKYNNDITLDLELFSKIKIVFENQDKEDLTGEQKRVLEKIYKGFTRNGALLSEEDKNTIRSIDEEMSKLDMQFTENVRNANNAFIKVIDKEDDLKGMPEAIIEAAKGEAKKREMPDKWVFTLDYPSLGPFMQYCQNRELRQEMAMASGKKAFGGEFDNSQNVLRMLELKDQRAKLLGYKNHSCFILEERMAKNPETVMSFLGNLHDKAKSACMNDKQKLVDLKTELTGDSDFKKYDSAFYTEILKKRELDLDDELLRPYFKLENVIQGVFDIATRLYDIKFKEVNDLPTFHEDVKVYEVYNLDDSFIGLFYADFHPREEKRPGAWMNDLIPQGLMFGKVRHPHISITCNFTKPTETKPSLLSLNEVTTLFHEFGHALHGLLSKCTYRSVAGTNVFWDFVELPSQVMENWVLEKECLDLFAVHYETGEKIPTEYVDKIKAANNFLEGLGTMRQLSFGFLDMKLHNTPPSEIKDVALFEDEAMKDYDPFPREGGNMLCSFGHIFPHGGYSSGYYSYKWAEVLDADAFEAFKENGIFDKATAKAFKENILEKGGSVDAMELYKNFRGHEPDVEPLLRRAGLI